MTTMNKEAMPPEANSTRLQDSLLSRRRFSQHLLDHSAKMIGMSTQKGKEPKMQDGSNWDTFSSNDSNDDSSWHLSSENYSDYSSSIFGAPKEVEYYSSRDRPLSIQNVFRNRSIDNHKKKNNESITKQAVKIASFEATSPAASGQTSHKTSIYKKLAEKHMPVNPKKRTYEIAKDACQETVESLKRQSDNIQDELNKLIEEGKQDVSSVKRRTSPKVEYRERVVTPPPSKMSRKNDSTSNMEKDVSQPSIHTLLSRKSQLKNPQMSSEEWNSLSESRNSQRFPWDGATSLVKQKTINSENGMYYHSYDPNYSFKLDM